MSETSSLMRRHPLFRTLPAETLDTIVAGSASETFRAADVLLRQGDTSDFAIVIVEGEIDVLAHTSSGPVKLASLSGAALLGEMPLARARARQHVSALAALQPPPALS